MDKSDVDYLCLDACSPSIGNSFETGSVARYFAQTGMSSELHTTSFSHWGEWDHKEVPFMQREATISIANGSSYMLWENHYPTGAIDKARWRRAKEVEKFVESRRKLFREGKIVGDIVLLSTVASYEDQKPEGYRRKLLTAKSSFLPSNAAISIGGASAILQYSARSFVMSDESKLSSRMSEAKVVILPKQTVIPEESSMQLEDFVREGGNLIAIGSMPENVSKWTGLRCEEPLPLNFSYLRVRSGKGKVSQDSETICSFGDFAPVKGTGAASILDYIKPDAYEKMVVKGKKYSSGLSHPGYKSQPAALRKKIGKGVVILCGANIFQGYANRPSALLVRIMDHLLESSAYQPGVSIMPNRGIEIVERVSKDRHLIHIINLLESNNYPAMAAYFPPLRDIQVSVACSARPNKIYLLPGRKPVEFRWGKGCARFHIDKIPIHTTVEILV